MDLTEAEDNKKKWQDYTELYKKDLHEPDKHDGVITHLEPDILECASLRTKLVEVMEFQDWKRSVFIPIPNKGNSKECSNNHTIALISQASKVMLKILQARLQQYVNYELPDVQAVFRKGRGIRDRTANTQWIIEKIRRVPEKHLFLLY